MVATIFIAAIVSALLMVIGVWAFHLNYTCLFISFKSSVSESLFTKVVNWWKLDVSTVLYRNVRC